MNHKEEFHMASSLDFVHYICQQIDDAGIIAFRKMFGEYTIYCNGKVIGLICDNQFFVKKTVAGVSILPNCKEASPYTNAKPCFVIDSVDDKELMTKLIRATYQELPNPRLKKKK